MRADLAGRAAGVTPRTAFIGLGANLGDRQATLREAVHRLASLGTVTAVSSLYETEPVGFHDQPLFLNAVAALETGLEPGVLVQGLLDIERTMGRERTFRNAPRTLDLDLLLLGEVTIDTEPVALPHPRLHERAFVLVPLAEIAPDAMHPRLRQPILALLAGLPADDGVRRFAPPAWALTPSADEESAPDR